MIKVSIEAKIADAMSPLLKSPIASGTNALQGCEGRRHERPNPLSTRRNISRFEENAAQFRLRVLRELDIRTSVSVLAINVRIILTKKARVGGWRPEERSQEPICASYGVSSSHGE